MVKVIKRSGKEEEFLGDKVYNSLINASTSEEVAKQIVKELKD
jgi:transcriptional regulator NrdR family protein